MVTWGHAGVQPHARRRPAADPEVGPRLRRGRRASCRSRMGRARGVPLADRRGGRRDRAVRRRLPDERHGRPDRPHPARRRRGAVLGRRRHRHGDHGLGARRRRHRRQRHPRAGDRVGAAVLRHRRTRSSSAPSASASPTPGPTSSSLRTRAVYDGATDEWVLNGTKAWITNGGIADVHVVVATVDPELKGRGQASFVVPARHEGPDPGPEVQEARHPRVAHRRGRARRRTCPRQLPARRQGEARRQAGAGS